MPTEIASGSVEIEYSGPESGKATWTIEVSAANRLTLATGGLQDELAAAVAAVRARGGGTCRLWIGHVGRSDDEVAARWGFTPHRDLWQLRAPLPAAPSDLAVRPFEPGDAEAVLAVNRRAFSWHPEQGAMTADDLRARQAEPWYDPAGFLLHECEGSPRGVLLDEGPSGGRGTTR